MQFLFKKTKISYWVAWIALFIPLIGNAQNDEENRLESATLEDIIQYALKHQPEVKQAQIDEEITEQAIKGKLADWYPQINFNYNYQRYIDLQSSVIGGQVIRFGVNNTSSAQFTATQNVFNRDALLASKTASKVRIQASQNTSRSKIDVAVDVTKAVYDVLATMQQIKVSEESIIRLNQSLKDAKNRYVSGVSDKTDFQRATILVRNAEATLKSNTESLKYKKEYLKALMGYPQGEDFILQYDEELMESEILLDTAEQVNYSSHIDYKIIQTQRELQKANLKYSKWAFLPSVNLFGAYNLNYQNNNFGDLYNTRYPYSYVGATLSLPLFQGGKRLAKVQEEKWASSRLDLSLVNLENNLNTAYVSAISSYKSNLALYLAQKENVELAQEVYDIIQLQYTNGVKTYLDVTTSESELRTTRINYFNALYLVLASKVDVQHALGQINY
ncbi:TolC family protein [Reichenbachiella sp. MALMAid0571]|uniref:TolC family protein n=1 Tax=Reichenbachiella sp. MALMAid0571 TaxID=3143939 RepID=UPI0032DF576A